jgi:glycerophosphoryl diester phosphodiesterase
VSQPAPFLCIGHRGASGYEPENTLRSIRRALELGVDGIEIDVYFVDGELVVFHDSKLDRTTNGRGYLRHKTFAQLRELDAGCGEQIPTLREVFLTVNRRAFLNIELKGRRTAAPVEALIREFIQDRGWSYEDFLVSSFQRRELRMIADPGIRIGLLLTRPSRLYSVSARRVRAWSVHSALRFVTARFVDDAHRRGYKVFVYTVNSPADVARMRKIGVDGIFTDFPDRVNPDAASLRTRPGHFAG